MGHFLLTALAVIRQCLVKNSIFRSNDSGWVSFTKKEGERFEELEQSERVVATLAYSNNSGFPEASS